MTGEQLMKAVAERNAQEAYRAAPSRNRRSAGAGRRDRGALVRAGLHCIRGEILLKQNPAAPPPLKPPSSPPSPSRNTRKGSSQNLPKILR